MAYDPEYRKYAPGKYLMMKTIEAFCDEKGQRQVNSVDFGLGDAEYKRMLCDQTWLDASPSIFAPNLRGLALNAYRTPLVQLDLIGRHLLSSNLEARVKRVWRNRVAGRQIERANESQ
jgi:CelD/BcsL family acetyltransferase involved in cellulose biosynthesis